MKHLFQVLAALIPLASVPIPAGAGAISHVVVIAMENSDAGEVYGNSAEAPYINGVLMPQAAHAEDFLDLLPLPVKSEPHYVAMEAGTPAFADTAFDGDGDPSAKNSTASSAHLATQLTAAGMSWMSYQEALSADTGACPIKSRYPYAAKHNPFVFFQDVAGNPPSRANAFCAGHHRPYSAFAADLAAGRLAQYVFISPGLCHDMHNECGGGRIRSGDDWLKSELPGIMQWAGANHGVIFIVWDEGHVTAKMPFLALGPAVRRGFAAKGRLTQLAVLKSIEMIFGVPVLPTVAASPTLEELFEPGRFP